MNFKWLSLGIFFLLSTTLSYGNDEDSGDSLTVSDCIRCVVITNQAMSSIDIVDLDRNGKLLWRWDPQYADIEADKKKWFSAPDDAKPVYHKNYILINASGGGVALIRIIDKKVVFYAYAGKNPHSSEILPDGNIVTASSTDNKLVIFAVDTAASGNHQVYRQDFYLPFAHNVVWDKKRKLLWSAGDNHLYKLEYNFDKDHPALEKIDSLALPGENAHDLFPVYGKDLLWLTTTDNVYVINLESGQIRPAHFKFHQHIKSVSSGPEDWPILIMKPKVKWWTDVIINPSGKVLFRKDGMEAYKARWFLENAFSY